MAAYEGRIPIEKIKDKSEYESHKSRLEHFLNEYHWLKHANDPLLETKTAILDALKQLDTVTHESEDEKELLHQIYLDEVKYEMIKDGSYEAALLENIKAETMLLDEFEQSAKYPTRWEFLKGVVRGDKEARKLIGYSFLRNTGKMVTPVQTTVVPPCKVLFDFACRYSFVGIDGQKLKDDAEGQMGEKGSLAVYQGEAGNGLEGKTEASLNQMVLMMLRKGEKKSSNVYLHETKRQGNGIREASPQPPPQSRLYKIDTPNMGREQK